MRVHKPLVLNTEAAWKAATPRERHYGQFYGLRPVADEGRPLVVVHGNCQAEALRVLVDGEREDADVVTVRIPPVHELTSVDVDRLHALMGRVDVLVSHPVRDGYRDLPVGTHELAQQVRASAQVMVVPIVRYAGLHPYQAIARHPREPAAVPDVVPYHDLRLVAALAAGLVPDVADLQAHSQDPDVLREVARGSLAELEVREKRCDIQVADVIAGLGVGAVHTINHPGNALLMRLAARIVAAAGLSVTVQDPGRVLLGGFRAPVHPSVAAALGLSAAGSPEHWLHDGVPVSAQQIVAGQVGWYRRHPWFVQACLERYADRLGLLGLPETKERLSWPT